MTSSFQSRIYLLYKLLIAFPVDNNFTCDWLTTISCVDAHTKSSHKRHLIRWYIAQPLLPVRILAMKRYLNRNGKDFVSKSYESQNFSSLLKWYPESTSSPLIKSLQPTLKALLLDSKIEIATSTKIVEWLLILDCFSCCIIHCWFTTTLFTGAGYFVSKAKSEFS